MDVRFYKALVELMSAVGSCRDLQQVLASATAMVVQAAEHEAGFLYLWYPHLQRLVLSATSPGWERWIQTVHLRPGEGIVGWCAQHKEVVLIENDALQDRRFKFVPGLDDDMLQHALVVPVIASSGELVGVFIMSGSEQKAFPPGLVNFVLHVATLLAGVIEKARLYTDMAGKLSVLSGVEQLSRALSSHQQVDAVLAAVTAITGEVMRTDACAIWLVDGDYVRLQSLSAGLAAARLPRRNLPLDPALQQWLAPATACTGGLAELPRVLHLTVPRPFDYWAADRLGAENGAGGFILCLRNRLVFIDEELNLLDTIAAQTAVAVSRAHLIQRLSARERTTAFFEVLMSGTFPTEEALLEQGRQLGADLSGCHLVVAAEFTPLRTAAPTVQPEEEAIWHELGRRLQAAIPGSLPLHRDALFHALVPVQTEAGPVIEALHSVKRDLEARHPLQLSLSVSSPCHALADYPQGLTEAIEALRIGQTLLWDRSRVIQFRDLGIYRYLYKIWVDQGDVRDQQQQMLQQLLAFDRKHGTDLLVTLEAFLECLGHTGDTAEKLFIHRNSVRNRLQKISLRLQIDITDRRHWFPLYLALQIVKIREAARRGGPTRREALCNPHSPSAQELDIASIFPNPRFQ